MPSSLAVGDDTTIGAAFPAEGRWICDLAHSLDTSSCEVNALSSAFEDLSIDDVFETRTEAES